MSIFNRHTAFLLLIVVVLSSCDSLDEAEIDLSEIDGLIWLASEMPGSDATRQESARMRFVSRQGSIALLDSCGDPSWIYWEKVGVNKLEVSRVARPWGGFCYSTAPFDLIAEQTVTYKLTRHRLEMTNDSTGRTFEIRTDYFAPLSTSGLVGKWEATDDGFAPIDGWADAERPVFEISADSTYSMDWDCSSRGGCARYHGILGVGYNNKVIFYQRGDGNRRSITRLNELLVVRNFKIENDTLLLLDKGGLITHKFRRSPDPT